MPIIPTNFRQYMYLVCIKPRATSFDDQRHEFILNVILSGLLAASSLALIVSVQSHIVHQRMHLSSLLATIIFWLLIIGLFVLSRKGRSKLAAGIFISFLLLSGLQYAVTWGFNIAIAELVLALTITIAGVLFNATAALLSAGFIIASLVIVALVQITHVQHPQTYWQHQAYGAADAIGFIAIFVIMATVSWLSNREIDRSLQRARRSEADLQKERDNLELTVIRRTQELEELQLSRLLELQPFAEFGRIGAGLVHEISNPLTAAGLHLEELSRQQSSELVHQVQRNLHALERYLLAARKQIKRETKVTTFSVGGELRQIIALLQSKVRAAGVDLQADRVTNVKIRGDVVKFNQLVANLLANAIDAASTVPAGGDRTVSLHVTPRGDGVEITISDHGVGIKPQQMAHLFEPFYTTKTSSVRKGLGIGLALVKQYVEHDFHGSIAVTSSKLDGTTFIVRLNGIPK